MTINILFYILVLIKGVKTFKLKIY